MIIAKIKYPYVSLCGLSHHNLLTLSVCPVNWCQHWFEYFPNPPLNILGMVENVLAHHDRELLQHLVHSGITSQVRRITRFCSVPLHLSVFTLSNVPAVYLWQLYVWPLLESLFSEVLTRDEWLRLFDSVFSNHPSFLLMACVAYITCCRQPLLRCSQKQDFDVTILLTFGKKKRNSQSPSSNIHGIPFFSFLSVLLPPS